LIGCEHITRKGYAIKTLCKETLENGSSLNCHLRSDVIITLGGNDMGLEKHLHIACFNT
jgi:hypothetical protein